MGENEKTFTIENESLKEFFVKAANDQEAQAKLRACTTPDEAYAVASSIQGGFTKEEFMETASKIQEAFGSMDLTDEDLNALSGGLGTQEIVGISLGSVISAAVIAGILAL